MNKKIKYSVVVPVYNEEGNVGKLHTEIVDEMRKLKADFEIIFVNDASTDNTLESLKKLYPITIVDLRKNSGQSSAMDAGIKQANGEIIVTMDGDGQNDPSDIPSLLEKMNQDFDVVCGWRYKRQDSFEKRFMSRGARFLRRFLVDDGVHDSGCSLRVYKKECFTDLDLYGEMHRMIPALMRWRGFKITEIKVNHRARTTGMTKYNWKRSFKGFTDMLGIWFWRKYETRPLHLFGSLGVVMMAVSLVGVIVLAVARLFFGYLLSDKIWPMVFLVGFLFGFQVLSTGILADLVIKNRDKKSYYNIRQVVKNDK